MQKYAEWTPRQVWPVPPTETGDICRVFYHGTASHGAEIRWLKPVIASVVARDERIVFEIVGGTAVWRHYRELPRVNLIHPMTWPPRAK